MIEREQEYRQWVIRNRNVEMNTVDAYVKYLNHVSENIGVAISPRNLSTQDDIERICAILIQRKIAPHNRSNWKTAMRRYTEMVVADFSKGITNHTETISDAIDDLDAWPEGIAKPEKVNRSVSTYPRNVEVRRAVLSRAKGRCEFCGEEGFIMQDGNRHYLEAHHIITLANDGSDTVENVIALCPKHHREAHFGIGREVLETQMSQIVRVIVSQSNIKNEVYGLCLKDCFRT